MGSAVGAAKIAAHRVGIDVAEYEARVAAGLKWCSRCKEWQLREAFGTDRSRGDGLTAACRDGRVTAAHAWYAKQSDEWRRRRMAAQRGLDPVPEWWRAECFAVFNHSCAYGCGRIAEVLDHIWPVSRGGRSTPGNLVPVCPSCNRRKSAGDATPWIEKGFAAFPDEWSGIFVLAIEHDTAEWIEVA